MEELRLVRRDDQSLIVATDTGKEYSLTVDEAVLAELRQLSKLIERGERDIGRVNPREVQSLVRAGKSRAEIAEITGLEESDIERYEEPVLAERRYMLELAHAIAVRTSPEDEDAQQFGTVIAERLIGLGAEDAKWASWRDEEAGWMISLEFTSRAVEHRAVWAFEHRKRVLSPVNSEAETLSKQGDVGDRLIPKLRAVDSDERFDSDAFDPDRLPIDFASDQDEPSVNVSGPVAPDHPSTGSIPVVNFQADNEFARRQHIEERAIKSPAPELPDLGQTADLLDALRRRRGERDVAAESRNAEDSPNDPVALPGARVDSTEAQSNERAEVVDFGRARPGLRNSDGEAEEGGRVSDLGTQDGPQASAGSQGTESSEKEGKPSDKERRKGRAAIPSWDDILFGTRSDEDPA